MNNSRKQSMSQFWTSYKWWTLFFPKELKEQTYLLYAFVREADNFVDDKNLSWKEANKKLLTMQKHYHDSIKWKYEHWNTLCKEFAQLCIIKDIPTSWVDDFFAAMLADTKESYYKSYKSLQTYMRWSAEVVWLMMCKLIWYDPHQEEEVFRTAKLLWEAMQYTNFLRDVLEDWMLYWRIYMPSDRLQKYDCNHECIKRFCEWNKINSSRETFMAQQISLTKELYKEANTWIKLLNKQGRFAVQIASTLYEWILDRIRVNTYDVFTKDCHTSKFDKFWLFLKALVIHASW